MPPSHGVDGVCPMSLTDVSSHADVLSGNAAAPLLFPSPRSLRGGNQLIAA